MRTSLPKLQAAVLMVILALLGGCDKPSTVAQKASTAETPRGWDIPTDPQEKAAYDYAHSLKLPDSVPKPVPYDFAAAERKERKGGPNVSEQYFEHLCKTEAGEYIFKTVNKVEGLYQMRPRHKATTDEFRNLYQMEDPYGYVGGETQGVAFMLVKEHRYRYLEQAAPGTQFDELWRSSYDPSLYAAPADKDAVAVFEGYTGELNTLRKHYEQKRISRYGYTWRGIRRERDRELGVAGGELIVLDLETNELLGVRRGFAITSIRPGRTNWEFTPVCPRYEIRDRSKDVDFFYWFIRKALRPVNPVEWPNVKF